VLETRRDVHRVAKRGEYGTSTKSDIANDDLATMNADPELDRLAEVAGELVIHVFDIGGNQRRRAHGLPASCLAVDVEPEQGEHSVAEELVGLAAGISHSLRCRGEKSVDQENHVERQPIFCEFGRAPHVDKQADDVSFLAKIDTLTIAHEFSADIRREKRNNRNVGLR